MARYLYGETNPISAPVATPSAVSVGDLIAYDASGNNSYPASAETWSSDLATTQANFVTKFLGASGQKKLGGEARVHGNSTDNILRVDCSGVFECDAGAATYEIGEYVGPAKDSGNALVSGTVAKVADATMAIGRVIENSGASATKVKIQLLSKLNSVSR